jgi:lysophospholipase L1-like esterase
MSHHMLKSSVAVCLVSAGQFAVCGELAVQSHAKWEKEIAAFERSDAATPPPKGALLFTGSSTIRLWTTLAQDYPQHPVINRGFGGSQIADVTHFAPRIIFPYAPKAIYLRSGGNDLWAGKSVEQVFADFREFVATVQAKLPDTDIIYISLSPSIARWKQADQAQALNALVSDFVKGKAHLRYVETYDIALDADGQPRPGLFAKDKLHFSVEGYKLLAERIRPDLIKTGAR